MSKVKVVLDWQGINQLRKSAELGDFMTQLGQGIASRCSGNYEVKAPYEGKYHSNVEVVTADNNTFYRNLHNNELLKAVHK